MTNVILRGGSRRTTSHCLPDSVCLANGPDKTSILSTYMPLRSLGCFLCRKRKIRCDGTRPHCERCAIHGVECPGYRIAPGEVEWRHENLAVSRGRQRSTGQTSQEEEKLQRMQPAPCLGFAADTWAAKYPIRRSDGRPGGLRTESLDTSFSAQLGSQPDASRAYYTPLWRITSPEAYRAQVFSEFINLYAPSNISAKDFRDECDFSHFPSCSLYRTCATTTQRSVMLSTH